VTAPRPIFTEGDVLNAAAHAASLAAAAGCDALDQARIHLAALTEAADARRAGGDIRIESNGTILSVTGPANRHEFALPGEPRDAAPFAPASLLQSLDETVRESRAQMTALQSELDETNRGVLALYSELDDRAEKLKRADELKSRFLSYASHELRTPLNGIVSLIRLLNTRTASRDPEEQKQLAFILQSAEEMREMVNDLLDLAKVEAGKVTIQPTEFNLDFIFGALRGIFRPLLHNDNVVLAFDDTSAIPSIYSDEAKVSQILRNLISNAIKFTEQGEVRVWAESSGDLVRISVRDTGIGIAPEHIHRIFEEYAQIEHPLQRRVRGTGLGLPLCRKLAHLLGGRIEVESEIGEGSTFSVVLPRLFESASALLEVDFSAPVKARAGARILIIEHGEIDRYLLGQLVRASSSFEVLQAEDGRRGLEMAHREQPDLIFLDLGLPMHESGVVLSELRAHSQTARIPVVGITGRGLSAEHLADFERSTVAVLERDKIAEARAIKIHTGPPVRLELCHD
jgi:signal transduction histidine kinase